MFWRALRYGKSALPGQVGWDASVESLLLGEYDVLEKGLLFVPPFALPRGVADSQQADIQGCACTHITNSMSRNVSLLASGAASYTGGIL
jgi:hypothetical protein